MTKRSTLRTAAWNASIPPVRMAVMYWVVNSSALKQATRREAAAARQASA